MTGLAALHYPHRQWYNQGGSSVEPRPAAVEQPTVSLTLQADPVPLRRDEQGGIRVGGTRVLLELVIDAYREGATPETIVRWFDSLHLADVYAVISYYLKHKDEVEDYLRRREELAAEVRRTIEAGQSTRPNLREELLARRARMENSDAADGQ